MLKRLAIILLLIVAFVFPAYSSSQTLEQERSLIEYIAETINDYVKQVDWFQDKNYTPEMDHIQSLVTKFGYKKEECFSGMMGYEPQPGMEPIPIAIVVIIKGKANPTEKPYWKIMFKLQQPAEPNKNVPKAKKFGI